MRVAISVKLSLASRYNFRGHRVRSSVGFARGFKDRLNGLLEEPRNIERKRKAGVVFPGFNCVHSLARYVEVRSEFRLRPAAFCSKNSEPILHC